MSSDGKKCEVNRNFAKKYKNKSLLIKKRTSTNKTYKVELMALIKGINKSI
jgi:hypothetical protein